MDQASGYWMRLYPDTYLSLLGELRAEKEKFSHWKDRLEKERNEAYAQLKLQAQDAERTRRGLERARQEVVHQVTVISAEKDYLERENEELKERLEAERAGAGYCIQDFQQQRRRMTENVVGLEKELSALKLAARQTATLNSQLQKAMKHLATCRRRKCSVCAYTKASFGEFAGRNDKKLFTCFQTPLQDLRNWMRPVPGSGDPDEAPFDLAPPPPPSPPPSLSLRETHSPRRSHAGNFKPSLDQQVSGIPFNGTPTHQHPNRRQMQDVHNRIEADKQILEVLSSEEYFLNARSSEES